MHADKSSTLYPVLIRVSPPIAQPAYFISIPEDGAGQIQVGAGLD